MNAILKVKFLTFLQLFLYSVQVIIFKVTFNEIKRKYCNLSKEDYTAQKLNTSMCSTIDNENFKQNL